MSCIPRRILQRSFPFSLIVSTALCLQAYGADYVVDADETWAESTYTYDNVQVTNGATLTLDGAVRINAANLTVDAGSAISAEGTGYVHGEGPGVGNGAGAGGGYGGRGGDAMGNIGGGLYGSAVEPTELGSGAGTSGLGTSGSGGGAIRLVVSGTLAIHGTISANGGAGDGHHAGGGSGGSLWIETGTLTGVGSITAHGGNGGGSGSTAGGGGGRIALYYATSDFAGTAAANPGTGTIDPSGNEPGTVGFFDTTAGTFRSGHSWRFHAADSPFDLNAYTVTSGAMATMDEGVTFGATTTLALETGAQCSLYPGQQVMDFGLAQLSIAASATLSASASGHGADEGPGRGIIAYGAPGGGYGGRGGDCRNGMGGGTYGSACQPTDIGSGGATHLGLGGSGGGAIHIAVTGTLTLDGTIAADGGTGTGHGAGGGSGGSVYIEAGHIAGAGTLSAIGGDGSTASASAGGGGGRIAVYYATNAFSGTATVAHGTGTEGVNEEEGTVGFFDTTAGTLRSGHSWRFLAEDSPFDLDTYTVTPGAIATIEEGVAFGATTTLALETGAQCSLYPGQQVMDFGLAHLSIADSATLSASASGNGADEGPGRGIIGYGAPGGGYGGRGGDCRNGMGGGTYGSACQPTDIGSGGATHLGIGGSGGGAIHIAVTGTLTLDGTIAADGGAGTGHGAGGGSGGSVYIDAGLITGAGTLSAIGGDGSTSSASAGGGGGRIAVHYATNAFSGTVTVAHGTGTEGVNEEEGTAAFFDTQTGDILFYSRWRLEPEDVDILPDDLAIPDSAEVHVSSGVAFEFATLTIEEGGLLTAIGHPAEEGPGAGLTGVGTGGGGGHGGRGGASTQVAGGEPYGSASFPVDLGSGGGDVPGGRGGGAIRLIVTDTLTVNGAIDVRGGDSDYYGAGSGGSIYITTEALTGSGHILATGGSTGGNSGGGGGGRIAIYHDGSTFTGTIDASGGSGGYEDGDDGTALLVREVPIALGDTIEQDITPFSFTIFRLPLDAGDASNVVARLTPLGGPGEWTFIGRQDELPGLAEYDWASMPTTLDHLDILVPAPAPGAYYFGVYYAEWAKQLPRFRMECFDTDKYVASLSTNTGGNSGTVTVELGGIGFEDGVLVELRSSTGATIGQFTPSSWDSDSLTVRLDLRSIAPQVADVVVVWPNTTELALDDAFEIVEGGEAPQLQARVVLNDKIRGGRVNTMWVEYENIGDTDLDAPLLLLECEDAYVQMRLDKEDPWAVGSLQFFAVSPTGDPSVLPPGTSNRISVQYLSTGAAHTRNNFTLSEDVSGTASMEWDTMKADTCPAFVAPDVWDRVWPLLMDRLGATWDAYKIMLRANASYLARRGVPAHDVQVLLNLELQKFLGFCPRKVLEAATDAECPVSGPDLSFDRTYYGSLSSRLYEGPLGRGWAHRYDLRVREVPNGPTVMLRGGFPARVFYLNEDGTYTPSAGNHATLTKAGHIFTLREKDGTVYVFTSAGTLDYIEDPYGNRVTAGYTDGNLTTVTHSSGDTLTLAYDGDDRIVTLSDHTGEDVTYTYDNGNLATVSRFGATITTYTYNGETGEPADYALTAATNATGVAHTFAYDELGRLAAESEGGAGHSVSLTYTYDSDGPVTIENAHGDTWTMYPDYRGVCNTLVDALGRTTNMFYDDDLNLIELYDPTGARYRFEYDLQGNLLRAADPLGRHAQFTYDPDTNAATSYTDGNWNTTTYSVDAAGGLTSVAFANGAADAIVRNAEGRVTSYTNRRGHTIAFTRNARGQVTQKQYPGGATVTYTYDTEGRLTTVSDATGDTVLTYGSGELVASILYPNGHGFAFTYNDAGQRTQRMGTDGYWLNYTYNDAGRLASVTDPDGVVVEYAYDDAGRVASETKGNGTSTVYTYTASGEVASMTNYASDGMTVQSQFAYEYDANGNPTAVHTHDGTWTYSYDAGGRLLQYNAPDGSWEAYSYDTNGNRVYAASDDGTDYYTVNELNQVVQAGDTFFTYDADGNVIAESNSEGTKTFTYDYDSRLVSEVEADGTITNYTYDGLGNLVSQTRAGVVTQFINDPGGLGGAATELNGADELQRRYVDGLGLVAQLDTAGNPKYFNFDAVGDTRQLTDAAGALTHTFDYSPFGAILSATKGLEMETRYSAGGRYRDRITEARWVKKGNRYYNTRTGIWMSPQLSARYEMRYRAPEELQSALVKEIWNKKADIAAWVAGLPSFGTILNAASSSYGIQATLDAADRAWNDSDWRMFLHSVINYLITAVGIGAAIALLVVPGSVIATGAATCALIAGTASIAIDFLPSAYEDYRVWSMTVKPGPRFTNPHWYGSNENTYSDDPNEKVGPEGWGANHIITGEDPLFYTVYFENKSTASAPAQEVFVTDVLDGNLDWSTFRLAEVVWGDQSIDIPPNTGVFYQRKTIPDHREGEEGSWWLDLIVEREGSQIDWTFRTLDPETGELPEAFDVGFLPPNDDNGIGEGHVSFTIEAKPGLALGTVITNSASIVFDVNDPIVTNEVLNTIGEEPAAGDIDASGSVNAVDVQLVINEALNLDTGYNCDINGSGVVDAVDVQLVINAALGIDIS